MAGIEETRLTENEIISEGTGDSNPNPNTQIGERRKIESNKKSTCKTIRNFAIGIFTLIVCTVLIVRTSMLVAIPLQKINTKDPCLLNSTTDITSIFYSSSSKYIQRLSFVMMIIITLLEWPAHAFLFFHLYKFFEQKCTVWEKIYSWQSFLCKKCYKGLFVIFSLLVYTVAVILAITGDIIKLKYFPLCEDSQQTHQIITYVYYATTFFTYILEVAERWLMVRFTASIGAMWQNWYEQLIRNGQPNPMQGTQGSNATGGTQGSSDPTQGTQGPNATGGMQESSDPTQGTQGSNATQGSTNPMQGTQDSAATLTQVTTKKSSVIDFITIVNCVKPIYKIFRSFFVFQWIVHVYLLFAQLVYLLYPWIKDGIDSYQTDDKISKVLFTCNSAAVVYYALALIIPYVCGLKMNSYRRRYIRKARLTQEQLLRDDRENKSIFTPRVPGTGLSISLESPGYMLGVVLTMFGLVGALLAM